MKLVQELHALTSHATMSQQIEPSMDALISMRRPRNSSCFSLIAVSVMALAGCSVMGHKPPPPDWPALRIVEHYVPDEAMRERCAKYVPFGLFPESCTEFYFDRGECHIWYSADYPPQPYVKAHERAHCEGRDHYGENAVSEIWRKWKASR